MTDNRQPRMHDPSVGAAGDRAESAGVPAATTAPKQSARFTRTLGQEGARAMAHLIDTLASETVDGLRRSSSIAEEMERPAILARHHGWEVANEAYQASMRDAGFVEMTSLLDALGLHAPLGDGDLRGVVEAAVDIFFHTDGIEAEQHLEERGIRVDVTRCPLYTRFADPAWHGLTACGCFARRRGWYDALGIPPDEEVVLNRKWDDPVCEIVIHAAAPLVQLR